MEKVKGFGLPMLMVAVALLSVVAPAVFRVVLYAVGFVVFCLLVMELRSGQEAKEKLRLKGLD
jgi:thiol:disulfide interchange protein